MRFFWHPFFHNNVLTWFAAGCSGTVCPYMERFGKGGVSEKSAVCWISHVTHHMKFPKRNRRKGVKKEGKGIKEMGFIKKGYTTQVVKGVMFMVI